MMISGNFIHLIMTRMMIDVMMIKAMKRRKMVLWSLILLPLLIILFYFCRGEMGSSRSRQPELQTFQLGNGWGYKILVNKKTLIYQPTIPAIDTVCPFPDERSARRTGLLVLNRLKHNLDISVTMEDLEHSLSD